jgi:aerobic-type carbon monoxide dehydrogenase small subunit (CoxS/CutS family)
LPKRLITLDVNGTRREVAVRSHDVLLDVLRENLNLIGTKRGCDMGTCGCCTVLRDGRPILSCLTLVMDCTEARIETIESVARGTELDPIQRHWSSEGGSQCGFCTPGFVMTTRALLHRNPNPSDDEICTAIAGNICRCTGYVKILAAIRAAAAEIRDGVAPEPSRG